MVTKKSLANALAKFISNDLTQGIDDRQMKLVLCMVKENLLENPNMLDAFLSNPMIKTVIQEEDGCYDISGFVAMLKKVLEEYGSYPISIPKVPLLLPHEKLMRINLSDIEKITDYLADSGAEI